MINQLIKAEQDAMFADYFQSKREESKRLWREVQEQSLELERLNLEMREAIQTLKAQTDYFPRFTPPTLPDLTLPSTSVEQSVALLPTRTVPFASVTPREDLHSYLKNPKYVALGVLAATGGFCATTGLAGAIIYAVTHLPK